MVRMQRVTGRTDDILVIKGVNVLPQYIEKILAGIEGCEPRYQVVARREHNRDSLEVRVEVSESVCFDEIKYQELFRERVRTALAHSLGLRVDVKLLERKTLEDELRKSGKVLDLRPV